MNLFIFLYRTHFFLNLVEKRNKVGVILLFYQKFDLYGTAFCGIVKKLFCVHLKLESRLEEKKRKEKKSLSIFCCCYAF